MVVAVNGGETAEMGSWVAVMVECLHRRTVAVVMGGARVAVSQQVQVEAAKDVGRLVVVNRGQGVEMTDDGGMAVVNGDRWVAWLVLVAVVNVDRWVVWLVLVVVNGDTWAA